MNNGSWGNVEGPVWVDDALYLSEMSSASYSQSSPDQKMARMLKVTADGDVSVFVEDSGSNGLAIGPTGDLLAGVHKDGSVTQFSLPDGTPTVLVSGYMGSPFNAPNDLAVHSGGTIFVSDPTFNAPSSPPQPETYVYRLSNGGEVEPIPNAENPDAFTNPNGVTLSLAEDYLYVAAQTGRRYPVTETGEIGAGEDFPATNGGDGMVIDCAGNLYVAKANSSNIEVYTPDGDSIGTIMVPGFQGVTNAAFGGPDRQTLYITGLGNDKGLFQLELDIPGRPY
ncbi:MAG TPA: SMP-30/gluconolactonase/LRE family protein [Polyangiaceae bacterium]|nr:SMP-30/gluconolactonase/LRE family protein [Polyangiaceae bacterium]